MKPKTITILYWIFTLLFAALMIFSAVGGIQPSPDAIKLMHDGLGYPVYFIPFISIAKLLGSITILIPGLNRIKDWAYAGLFFDLTAVIYSSIASSGNEKENEPIPPLDVGGQILADRRRIKEPAGKPDQHQAAETGWYGARNLYFSYVCQWGQKMEQNNKNTALLVMDMQAGIVGMLPNATNLLPKVAQAIASARENKIPVIYVTVGFRQGAPEVSMNNKGVAAAKERLATVNMDEFTKVHPDLAPQDG